MSKLLGNVTVKGRRDTAGNWTSNNPTPLAGERCLETDTGNTKIGDGATAWNALGYYDSLPTSYDISAANTVIALPAITGEIQKKTYYWTAGDGSHTFSFTVSDAATIGGIAATLWLGEGVGNITLESDGSNWQVKEYSDYLTSAGAGNFSSIELRKRKDGTAEEDVAWDPSGETGANQADKFGGTAGAIYRFQETYTSLITYVGDNVKVLGLAPAAGTNFTLISSGLTNAVVAIYDTTSNINLSNPAFFTLKGRWRT